MEDKTNLRPRTGPPDSAPKGEAPSALRYGHVVIERRLGAGGMAEVFLGLHEGFGLPVVVKLLPERFRDSELVTRFLREAQVSVRLEHPNVVRVFDVGRENDRVYIVMEYIEGQDLMAYSSDRGGRLPVAEALQLIGQAARGVAYAHAEGVIHRDIKPANLIRRAKDGRVKVLDFGIARSQAMDQLTSADQVMGTLAYMAPEQLKGQSSSATDVYALGVSLYQLLSGRLPAVGSLEELLGFHATGTPARLSTFRPVPEAVDALVGRMQAKDPAARPDAKAVVQEIDAILVAMGASDSRVYEEGPATPAPPGVPMRVAADVMAHLGPDAAPTNIAVKARPRGAPWLAAGVVLLAAVAAVPAILHWRAKPGPEGTPAAPPRPLDVAAAVMIAPPITRGIEGMNERPVALSQAPTFERAEVTQGKGIRFAFKSEEPLYVYVFLADEGGVYCLFPDYYEQQFAAALAKRAVTGQPERNPLPAGPKGILVVPPLVRTGEGMGKVWWFTFDATKGEEWMMLLASRAPQAELEAVRARLKEGKRVEAAELKTLAARWKAEMKGAAAAGGGQLPLEVYADDGERTLEPGGSFLSGPGRVVWTLELDHK